MAEFMEKFQTRLMDVGAKLSNNKFLQIIQKSFVATLPLTISASLALIISYFPFIDKIIPADVMNQIITFLDSVSTATLSIVGLYLCGIIGYYCAKEEDEEPIFGTIISMCCFLILTPAGWNDKAGVAYFELTWLGSNGILSAMIIGFLSSWIYNKMLKTKFTIKMPSSVPPMVAEPFTALIPAIVVFFVFACIRYGMGFTSFGNLHNFLFTVFQTPLTKLGTTLPAAIILVIFIQLLWFVGLHGQNITGAVMNPIWSVATMANLQATQAGQAPKYIFTGTFFSAFIWMQFFSLIIACLLFSKSDQLKSVAKVSFVPACFNISEPMVFGAPIVLNVMLLIPWVVTMVVYVLITWGFMASGLCPYPSGADIPWTTPPILSGYMSTGSVMGAVIQIICLVVGVFIYLPFVKAYDKQLLLQQAAAAKEEN